MSVGQLFLDECYFRVDSFAKQQIHSKKEIKNGWISINETTYRTHLIVSIAMMQN